MEAMKCPYCGQAKDGDDDSEFTSCRFCGFKSALVDSPKSGRLLIVDRRMPFLKRRCQDLAAEMSGVTVMVDRRVAQDERTRPERRLNHFEEGNGLIHEPRRVMDDVEAEDINPL
jgi:hypothetical protein